MSALGSHFKTIITYGTKDNPDGIPMRTTREVIIADIASKNEVLRETYVCSGENEFEPISWVATTRDEQNRITRIRKSDGTYLDRAWNGFQLAHEIGYDGVRTDYEYDSYGRCISSIRYGHEIRPDLITSVIYNPDNKILSKTVYSDGLSQFTTNSL